MNKYYLHVLDESGKFELIDGDFLHLYDIEQEKLISLTAEQYQDYINLNDPQALFIGGTFKSAKEPVNQEKLKQQQIEQMRSLINNKRDEVCFGGVYVEALGKWLDSDETSFTKMLGAKAVMDDLHANNKEVTDKVWVCADNSITHLTREDLSLIIATIATHVEKQHENAILHKTLLEQADDPQDYDYSSGWTKTYKEWKEGK